MSLPKIDWFEAQKDYLMDATLSYAEIGKKYGVSRTAVEKHANKNGWSELRNKLGEQATNLLLKHLAEKRARANDKHLGYWERIQRVAHNALETFEDTDTAPEPKELESIARTMKIAVEGERTALGLPTAVTGLTDAKGESVWKGFADLAKSAQQVLKDADSISAKSSTSSTGNTS